MLQLERDDRNVGGRALKGAAFLAGGRLIVRSLSLFNIVVMARLLEPTDFGIAAIAFVTLGLIQVFSDVRVTDGLLALDDLEPAHLDTAFTIQVIRGCLAALLLLVFSPQISSAMGSEELTSPLRVLSLVLILDGVRNPAFFLYQRNIDFSREFIRDIVSALLATSIAVTIALIYHSYWALIAGAIMQRVVRSSLSYYRISYRPSFGLLHWRSFIGFGLWLTLAGMIGQLTVSAPRILIGSLLSPAVLGVYVIARDLSSLATRELLKPLQRMLFPSFSAMKKDVPRLRRAILNASSILLAVALPVGCGISLLAEELIQILFGTKWLAATFPLQVLAPVAALLMSTGVAHALMMATRKVEALFLRALLIGVVTWPAIYIGIRIGGLNGATVAVAIAALPELIVNVLALRKFAGVAVRDVVRTSWRPLVSVAAMAAVLIIAPRSTDTTRGALTTAFETIPHMLFGAIVYIAVHYSLWIVSNKPNDIESYVLVYGRKTVERLRARRTARR